MAKVDAEVVAGFNAKKPKPGGKHHYSSTRGDIVVVKKNPRGHKPSLAEAAWICGFTSIARYTKMSDPRQFNEASTQTDGTGWYYRDALHSGIVGKLITAKGGLRITTPTANVYRDAVESLSSGVLKILTPNAKFWDNNYFWDFVGHPTRLTVRSTGLYLVGASVHFSATSGTYRTAIIRRNGTVILAEHREFVSANASVHCNPFTIAYFNEHDYLEIGAQTNTAGPTAELETFWILAITPELVS